MPDSAKSFISARRNPLALTQKRVMAIMQYIIYCYELQIKDRVIYSKSKRNSKQKFEDYLKTKLVDDYLRKNKIFFNNNFSDIEVIFFGKEETEIYTDNSDIEQEDKIDIYIRELGLQKVWSNDEKEEVYFAIECKRIEKMSDINNYITDIQKFTNRSHRHIRLPFEGMIAFVENNKLNYLKIANGVTDKLNNFPDIKTTQNLTAVMLSNTFGGSYISKHNKNFNLLEEFFIYHLLFDYSHIVIN